jgi:uncharacterized protein with HEPN domain
MQPEVVSALEDIVNAAEEIQSYTAGMSLDGYLESRLTRRAVERLFTIIGEALNNAMRLAPQVRERITTPRDIVTFRNLLVHGYSVIRDERVWLIVQEDLPLLLGEVRSLLDSAP